MKHDYDFVVQLSCDVVRDVQIRAINASLLRNLHVTSPFSRVVAQRIPPFRMKAYWGNPKLNYGDDLLKLSVDVRGGVRQPLKHINLTMEASVHADCQPRVVATEDDQPVVTLTAPSTVDLAELKLSYEGDDKPLSWVEKAIEKRILRRGGLARLMTSLAGLPLNYLPDSWPLRVDAKRNDMAADGLVLAESAVSLNPQAGSLTLAMRCAAETSVPAWSANLLEPAANTAVALSETGFNGLLGRLCAQGLATGTVQLGGSSASWCWTHVTASFTGGQDIHLTGELRRDETAIEVDTTVMCSLTSAAQLSVQLSGHGPQPPEADLVIEASAALVRRVFFAATRPSPPASSTQTEPDPTENLLQRFLVPGTGISAEAPVVALAVRDGYFIALYAVPMDESRWQLTLEKKTQEPTIDQSVVPRQNVPGVPVTVQFNARLTETEPPYDYAWRIDGGDLEPGHKSTMVKVIPPSMITSATETSAQLKLATVSVKVINILGQVGEAEIDAIYYPAGSPPESPGDPPPPVSTPPVASSGPLSSRWWVATPAIVAVIAVAGGVIGGAIEHGIRELVTPSGNGSGQIGPTGPPGVNGSVGATGAVGPRGPAGAIGPNGAPGAVGAVGPTGAVGPNGAVGPTGAVGPNGAVGPTGAAGPRGATGATGPPGPPGPTGPTGPTGPPGPPGSGASAPR